MTEKRIYRLQEGDTDKSIAQKLGISEYELQQFHNANSSLQDRIPYNGLIPKHLKEIVVPMLLENTHLSEERPELGSQNRFECDFRVLDHDYGVVIHVGDDNTTTRINYTVSIKCVKEFEYIYTLVLDKRQTYVNNAEPDLMVESLADVLGRSLFPIKVKIGREGWINRITNHDTIRERWYEEEVKIRKYFKSDIAKHYIDKTGRAYQDNRSINRALSREFFFALYFSGLYGKYFDSMEIDNTLRLPLFPFVKGIRFEVKQSLIPYLNINNNVLMLQQGEVGDPRTIEDIRQGKDFHYYESASLNGNVDIEYEFCRHTHVIKSIVGEVNLSAEDKT
ncbi:MAG: hypothetical protein ACK5MG_09400, partial [Bacteroidales bacterium]